MAGAASPAIQTVELALQASTAYQRPDLAVRARQALQRLHNPRVRILVVGEFKQVKSMLVNALVNAPICPIDDDISTSVPTVVRYAHHPSATLVRGAWGGGDTEAVTARPGCQLHDRDAAAVTANFLWATERARWLAAQVADLFEEDGAQSLPRLRTPRAAVPEMIAEMERPGGEKFGVGQRAFVGLRGGYIGTLMAGMASTFMGLTLLKPISAAAGLVMGGKMVRDESSSTGYGSGSPSGKVNCPKRSL